MLLSSYSNSSLCINMETEGLILYGCLFAGFEARIVIRTRCWWIGSEVSGSSVLRVFLKRMHSFVAFSWLQGLVWTPSSHKSLWCHLSTKTVHTCFRNLCPELSGHLHFYLSHWFVSPVLSWKISNWWSCFAKEFYSFLGKACCFLT